MTNCFTGELQTLIDRAINGAPNDVDFIISNLTNDSSFAMTRFVDYALSLVESTDGMERIKFYLFNGTLIQRNYACLYFNRLGEWQYVKQAYEQGLIDKIQAYSR